ncbi:MAG: hypothetical protein AAB834_05520 [Patescibacteria group bacterium]
MQELLEIDPQISTIAGPETVDGVVKAFRKELDTLDEAWTPEAEEAAGKIHMAKTPPGSDWQCHG